MFCDLDGASLANIAEEARALGVPSARVRLVQGDGVSTLDGELAKLTEDEDAGTFVHVDPYRLLEPGRGGQTPLGLFARAAERGSGACCGTASTPEATEPPCATPCAKESREAPGTGVSLRAEDLSEVGFDPGVLGCGVVMCNVSQEALAACGRLGEGLARAYSGARLPNGQDGALELEEGTF